MDAMTKGARQGERLRHSTLFERMTREEYLKYGWTVAKKFYTTEKAQWRFIMGWRQVNHQFFHFMADGPKRRITKVTMDVVCDKCGNVAEVEYEGNDINVGTIRAKYEKCPICEGGDWE